MLATPLVTTTGAPVEVVPEKKLVPAGIASLSATPRLATAVVLEIVNVSVTFWPAKTVGADATTVTKGGLVPFPDPVPMTELENSEVFPVESVAVAVTKLPGVNPEGRTRVKLAVPPFTRTCPEPMNVFPSAFPAAFKVGVEKNCKVYESSTGVVEVPTSVLVVSIETAEVNTGAA